MNAVRTLLLAGIAGGFISGVAIAQDALNQGYLVDTYGNGITTSSNPSLCVRSSDWTPARSVEPCDPVARKAAAPVPAPERTAAVAPPPPVAPAPAEILPQKTAFSADALFDFDKSALRPAGKSMLDQLAHDLEGASYDAILVVGHTDRIGGSTYNHGLSKRRAQAVKDYLVSRDVAAVRINAEGLGETRPVTKAGDCPDSRNAGVIACLQPDRRVDVEVTAIKAAFSGSR
jgi:OOP family OmpA-OmpF porin